MNSVNVAELFNGMAREYDEITDLWYSWLFCRLHYLIVRDLSQSSQPTGGKCLDVGCGTGFQSILMNLCGHDCEGIDIAADLVEEARQKKAEAFLTRPLFDAPFEFASRYSQRITALSESYRKGTSLGESAFTTASATSIPFANHSFDVVICCGSTLSFIEEYATALTEIARVLRPGGLLFLEVENKYNADLLWPLIDSAIFSGRLGYDQPVTITKRNLQSGRFDHVKVNYPFSTKNGEVSMPIWLFASTKLVSELDGVGITVSKKHSIHSVTNVIPSVLLDEPKPSPSLTKAFTFLASIEELSCSFPLIRGLGCSLVLVGEKRKGIAAS